MNEEIVIRFLLALAIAAAGFGIYQLASRGVLMRARNAGRKSPVGQPGQPAILYFTTPDCAPCKTIQRPALNQVKALLGEKLTVVEVNAYENPETAREWGVLSVPTTFILDERGIPRHVNHGATPAGKLIRQLQDLV